MKKSKLGKVFSCLIDIIFYPIILLVLAGVVMFAVGIRPYVTMSGSMEPYIHTGSVCFVDTRVTYDEIKNGDVIAFSIPTGARVTHRVINITPEGFETKGDNNPISDGISTNRDNYHGKTLFSIPYIGYAIKYMQQPVVLAIAAVIVLGFTAMNIVDRKFGDEDVAAEEQAKTEEKDLPTGEQDFTAEERDAEAGEAELSEDLQPAKEPEVLQDESVSV